MTIYSTDKQISATLSWDLYPYELSNGNISQIESPSKWLLKPEDLLTIGNAKVGFLPIRIKNPGEYLGTLLVVNPHSKRRDRVQFAVLTEDKKVFIGKTIPSIINSMPRALRFELLKRKHKLMQTKWKSRLPDISVEAACKSDLRDPNFSISESVKRCEAATRSYSEAAKSQPFSSEMLANYSRQKFSLVRSGVLTSELPRKGWHFKILPYTPIRITAKSEGPLTLSLMVRGVFSNTLGLSHLKTSNDQFCPFNPTHPSCPRGPDKDGYYRIMDVIVDDIFTVNVAMPSGGTKQSFRLEIEELNQIPLPSL